MADDEAVDDAVAEAADTLYAASVDDFMAVRTELTKAAKAAGDAAAAKAITALRKPTVAASVVNRLALADPTGIDRLSDLGDRLRTAQENLEATTLRELTAERRATVAEIVRAAFTHAEHNAPTTALRDEVSATFDAAVADPDVAGRLGRLVRAESFSGFGVVPGTPELTLVHGGKASRRSPASAKPAPDPEPAPKAPTATDRRLARRRDKARTDFDAADERFTSAEAAQQHESDRVRTLTDELAEVQHELDEAKRTLEAARRETRTARSRRRDAWAALDRAQRAADRGSQ